MCSAPTKATSLTSLSQLDFDFHKNKTFCVFNPLIFRLPTGRQGTRWLNVFKTWGSHRLIDPGSEWRLHRHWSEQSAMGDPLGEDFGLVQIDKLYRCKDQAVAP